MNGRQPETTDGADAGANASVGHAAVLPTITGPADLKRLTTEELDKLAAEIRAFLIRKVAATGGHLGPNLGVVELTLAIHRVFDSPHDPVIFDTGHQSYVHKILTGRHDQFDSLRQRHGLAGYPERAESEHDWTESSHASAALSYADGLAKAFALQPATCSGRTVVAVVGDGALTGGMCWEALNNIATGDDRPIVMVVNDNGRSYAPTIGGVARHLGNLRTKPGYERALQAGRRAVQGLPRVGSVAYRFFHGVKAGVKDALTPQVIFSDLGIKYVGPIDGHDLLAVEEALGHAKAFGGPVIVHTITHKGMGYRHAENDDADLMHAVGMIDPETGQATAAASGRDWTSLFSERLVAEGERRPELVAMTGAMAAPTGVAAFGDRFPDRLFDVGIAEQHALTSAAGLALGGMHPVIALYSTFLNRAFDQLLMDVALLKQPVTIMLDRSGITGPDGPSHHGMWDLTLAGMVPGLRAAAPRDADTFAELFTEALDWQAGPTLVRYPKGAIGAPLPAVRRLDDGVDVLVEPESGAPADVLLVVVGAFAALSADIAYRLRQQGLHATVVDPRWVLPVPGSVVELARSHRLVVTLEDSGLHGGIGSAVAQALAAANVPVLTRHLGIPQEFVPHGSRSELLGELGLTPAGIAMAITEWATAGGPARIVPSESQSAGS